MIYSVDLLLWLLFGYLAMVTVTHWYPTQYAKDNQIAGIQASLSVLTDHETGCQYLSTAKGCLTPRLDKAGKHMCGETK